MLILLTVSENIISGVDFSLFFFTVLAGLNFKISEFYPRGRGSIFKIQGGHSGSKSRCTVP